MHRKKHISTVPIGEGGLFRVGSRFLTLESAAFRTLMWLLCLGESPSLSMTSFSILFLYSGPLLFGKASFRLPLFPQPPRWLLLQRHCCSELTQPWLSQKVISHKRILVYVCVWHSPAWGHTEAARVTWCLPAVHALFWYHQPRQKGITKSKMTSRNRVHPWQAATLSLKRKKKDWDASQSPRHGASIYF